MKLFLALALLAAPGAMATPCPADIVGPGKQGGKPGPPDGMPIFERSYYVICTIWS
jgi:hypothetical protein|eukprot:COSAG01_NODE_13966_length_1507_cov_3.803395_2_plen_56_part_00